MKIIKYCKKCNKNTFHWKQEIYKINNKIFYSYICLNCFIKLEKINKLKYNTIK